MRRVLDYLAMTEPLEVASDGDTLRFTGYAAVFGVPSEDMGGFRVVIQPGAFARSLKDKRDVRMFLNHDDNIVLASTRAGTLQLSEDDKGLLTRAEFPNNEWGRPVADGIRRGDIHTMSVGFRSMRDEWADEEHKLLKKHEMRLYEVSPITSWAAFPQTTATMFALSELAQHIEAEPDALDAAIDKLTLGAPLQVGEVDLLSRAVIELAAVWDTAYQNNLPDASFACVDAGGEKDDQGKTTPRSLRHYVHHTAEQVADGHSFERADRTHVIAAWQRLQQEDTTSCGRDHIRRHREAMGIGQADEASAVIVHQHELALGDLRQRVHSIPD